MGSPTPFRQTARWYTSGIVYVGSLDRKLYAFNALTGAALWSTLTDGGITAPPSVANGVVYVTTVGGHNLVALDAQTGKTRWAVYVGGPAQVTPAVANGRVYATSTDRQVHAFNAATGASLWTSTSITPVNTSDGFLFSDAVVANGVVYITSDEFNISGNSTTSGDYSRLYAFHAMTGALLWSSALFKGTHLSTPMIDNGVVSVNSFSDNQTLYQASNKYTFHLLGTGP